MTHTINPYPNATADLPRPYFGYLERWVSDDDGSIHVALNVFTFNANGRQVYVKTIHGPFVHDVESEFGDWICGEYNSPLIG